MAKSGKDNGNHVRVRRPVRLKVGSRVYEVKYDQDSLEVAKFKGNDNDLWGCTDHQQMIIYISPNVSPYNQRCTLLHEALHCLFHATGGDVRNATGSRDDDFNIEEYMICRLEEPMMSLLVDNPDLVAYLVIGEQSK